MIDETEIDEAINRVMLAFDQGISPWPGMSYVDGLRDALLWVSGQSDENPTDELLEHLRDE